MRSVLLHGCKTWTVRVRDVCRFFFYSALVEILRGADPRPESILYCTNQFIVPALGKQKIVGEREYTKWEGLAQFRDPKKKD